jgi:hypothetical protein
VSSKRKTSAGSQPVDTVAGPAAENQGTSGRVKFDDRGNAVWDWQLKTGSGAVDSATARLRRLDNPTLSLADDAPTPFDKVQANPLGTKKGYDPYESGKLGKTNAAPKKKDLRRLSDWFKLKKQQKSFKSDGSDD